MKHVLPLLWFVTLGAWVELFEKPSIKPDPLLALFDLATAMPGVVVRCIHVALAFGIGVGFAVSHFA